ncbi:PITH domain-containing protein [Micractinium conductrix]|uniref:PITH domain-containing protein n=1 Tax=Micractinium conductrix TaxID=554055 RepID=A0A2P6VPF1_9CHLO|nr:PITH domain-containing protein [Micractinium conductrix]|eukprot:PSC75971.1 PITH domain-containing protein [Micractinium conductrix]
MADLLDAVDFSAVEALNQQPGHSLQNALKQGYREDDGLYLESDTDEQLLIHIPFNTACKLSGLVIKSTKEGQAPKRVKLFVNQPTIGFSEAADAAGVQEFDLSEEDLAGGQLQLKLVKFTKVNCLTIFIESNQGDEDTTIVQKLALFGSSGDSFNVAAIKDVSKEEK